MFLGSQVIDNGGTIKTRQSTWLEAGTLSVSIKNLAEGVKQVTTVFLVTEGTTVGPVTSRNTSNFEGLKTISVTTMQDKSGNALEQMAIPPFVVLMYFLTLLILVYLKLALALAVTLEMLKLNLQRLLPNQKFNPRFLYFYNN